MYIYLALSIAFLLATLATTFINPNIKKDLLNELTPQEIIIYKNITMFRLKIYYQGLFLGIFISLIYLYLNQNKDKYLNLFIAISLTFVTNYFYYMLYPKPLYMIEILNTRKENQAWLKIYKYMQFRYHSAFLFGLIFAYFLYLFISFN